MITTIIFDLSEVYLHGMYGIEEKVGHLLNLNIPNELYLTKESEQLFHGEITEEDFWKRIIINYNWNINESTLKQLIRRI